MVGFDDIEQAAWMSPPLTTVRQPFAEMGAVAAEVVLGLAEGTPRNVFVRGDTRRVQAASRLASAELTSELLRLTFTEIDS